MRRRDLVALLGSTAIAWPLVARAQQPSQMRRIGVLSLLAETDSEAQVDDAAFRKRLTDLGWTDGRNIRVDSRWGAGNVGRVQMFAKELVGAKPGRSCRRHHTVHGRIAIGNQDRSDCFCDGVRSPR